jgi:hypothetical protein
LIFSKRNKDENISGGLFFEALFYSKGWQRNSIINTLVNWATVPGGVEKFHGGRLLAAT